MSGYAPLQPSAPPSQYQYAPVQQPSGSSQYQPSASQYAPVQQPSLGGGQYAPSAPPSQGGAPLLAQDDLHPHDPSHPQARWRFDDLIARKEIRPDIADDLYGALTSSRVVLLLDDSGSMGTRVPDFLSMAYSRTGYPTRWSELDMCCHSVIDFVTATTPAGLDVHFLNRPAMYGVTDHSQIAPAFLSPPRGGTPIISKLNTIFQQYAAVAAAGQRVLVVVITDGEPSDGSTSDLFNLLKFRRHPNIHVSLAEMSDNEEVMAFLDGWDRQLLNFDNSDDYRMEARRVLRSGRVNKFSYNDYVVKIMLGSLMRKYFNLDQGPLDSCCCTIA